MDKTKKIRIIERVLFFGGTLLLLYFLFKFATYFMPFLIAGIFAILIEPVIKFLMNKVKLSRRVSSFFVVLLTIVIIILTIIFGGSAIIKEIFKLTENIKPAVDMSFELINKATDKVSEMFPEISEKVLNSMESSVVAFVKSLGDLISTFAGSAVEILLSVPTIMINTIITILALIFFTKDRIYVIDMLEHHLPKSWIRKSVDVLNEVFSTIGGYIRVYAKILIITFAELYIAFLIMNAVGFNVAYPLLIAITIAILDILPVLGVGTALIPWAIFEFVMGNPGFGGVLLLAYGIIFCIRQFIEPKLVSKQFGIHPLITLMAMYAGYRASGVFGLILGPVILMVLRCVFAAQIEKGLFKDIFEEK